MQYNLYTIKMSLLIYRNKDVSKLKILKCHYKEKLFPLLFPFEQKSASIYILLYLYTNIFLWTIDASMYNS